MRARIVLEMDEKTPLGYLNEFTTWLRKFRFVKEAHFEVVDDVAKEWEDNKGIGERARS